MAWLEIKADLTRTAAALERIAAAMERAFPPVSTVQAPKPRKVGIEDISRITDEDRVVRELEKAARLQRGIDG